LQISAFARPRPSIRKQSGKGRVSARIGAGIPSRVSTESMISTLHGVVPQEMGARFGEKLACRQDRRGGPGGTVERPSPVADAASPSPPFPARGGRVLSAAAEERVIRPCGGESSACTEEGATGACLTRPFVSQHRP
jgi:hypothetical protein